MNANGRIVRLGWASVLEDLQDKSQYVRWNDGARVEQFMVVSRSGFTRNAVDYARDHNVILLTPDDIRKIFV